MPAMTRMSGLLLVALALLAAGCGGKDATTTDKDAYVRQFNAAGQTLETTLTGIGKDVDSGTSGPDVAVKLDQSAKALDDAARRFERISPPSDARNAHRKIVDGLHELAAVFRTSARAARANDVPRLTRTLQGIEDSNGARKIKAAQRELRSEGYNVRNT
jgi:hypothetical protein